MKYILYWLFLVLGIISLWVLFFYIAYAEDYPISFRQETWLKTLAFCESGGRSNIKILDSNNKYSYGAYMFQIETFVDNGIKYKLLDKDSDFEKLIFNPELQEKIAHRMLLDGGEKHWLNCWKKKLNSVKYPKN